MLGVLTLVLSIWETYTISGLGIYIFLGPLFEVSFEGLILFQCFRLKNFQHWTYIISDHVIS